MDTDSENDGEIKVAGLKKQSPSTVAVNTNAAGTKKRKVDAALGDITDHVNNNNKSLSTPPNLSAQASMIIIHLEKISKSLGTLAAHAGTIARAMGGDRSRAKAAAAVAGSYSRASRDNSAASAGLSDESSSDSEPSDGESDAMKLKRTGGGGGSGSGSSSLAQEVADNAAAKAKKKQPGKGKDGSDEKKEPAPKSKKH
jgi:hypothetical protein